MDVCTTSNLDVNRSQATIFLYPVSCIEGKIPLGKYQNEEVELPNGQNQSYWNVIQKFWIMYRKYKEAIKWKVVRLAKYN